MNRIPITWRDVWIATAVFFAAAITSFAQGRATKPIPAAECTDGVLQLGTTAGALEKAECSHREHVLQRGREDGTLWLCICDAKGSEARRAR